MANRYTEKCPHCGCRCYIGFVLIECSNAGCKYYVKPTDDDETKVIQDLPRPSIRDDDIHDDFHDEMYDFG